MNRDGGFWIFQVTPYPDESFGHFLGRFRRANTLSRVGLAELLSVNHLVVRNWETPSRQQFPTETQLEDLSEWVGVHRERLVRMLPLDPCVMHRATRLCPLCYQSAPIHRQAWQEASLDHCERHQVMLLSHYPACQTSFRLPALWEMGRCEHCWLAFSDMTSESSTRGRSQ